MDPQPKSRPWRTARYLYPRIAGNRCRVKSHMLLCANLQACVAHMASNLWRETRRCGYFEERTSRHCIGIPNRSKSSYWCMRLDPARVDEGSTAYRKLRRQKTFSVKGLEVANLVLAKFGQHTSDQDPWKHALSD